MDQFQPSVGKLALNSDRSVGSVVLHYKISILGVGTPRKNLAALFMFGIGERGTRHLVMPHDQDPRHQAGRVQGLISTGTKNELSRTAVAFGHKF